MKLLFKFAILAVAIVAVAAWMLGKPAEKKKSADARSGVVEGAPLIAAGAPADAADEMTQPNPANNAEKGADDDAPLPERSQATRRVEGAPTEPAGNAGATAAVDESETSNADEPEYKPVAFDKLASFFYVPPPYYEMEAGTYELDGGLPASIKRLDGAKVEIVGYMLPLDYTREEGVRRFLLMRNQMMCCFGMPLQMNELMVVSMADGSGIKYYNDIPLSIYGKLEVGEKVEEGVVTSVYRVVADDVRPRAGY